MAAVDIDPLEVLKEDLSDENVEVQLEAIKALATIAIAMGPDRVCKELFVALESYCFPVEIQAAMSPEAYSNTDALAAKEEVLAAIAEHMTPDFIDYCGGSGPAAKSMLPLFEKLAMVEETVIRQNAVSSLSKVLVKLDEADVQSQGLPILVNLSGGEWFTSRCSASGLSASLYARLSTEDTRKQVLDLHQQLCKDDMPMVKSDAFRNLVDLIDSINSIKLIVSFVRPLLDQLQKELMESMRQSMVDIVAKISEKSHRIQFGGDSADDEKKEGCGEGDVPSTGIEGPAEELVISFVRVAAEDDSWRVRRYCASKLPVICRYLKNSSVTDSVSTMYLKLLSDTEPQVRKSAIGALAKMLECSDGSEFATKIAGKGGPIHTLVTDSVSEVREALAENIAYLGKHLSTDAISDVFLGSLKKLASDESPHARLNLCSKLSIVSEILSIEVFESEILPLLKEVTIDQRWRVRNSIVQNLADIGIQMKPEKFSKSRLREILIQSLKDPAATVRDTACKQVQKLHKAFGYEWMTKYMFEPMKSIYSESGNYLHRMVPLKALEMMAEDLTPTQIRQDFAPLLQHALDDPISNVRFTACIVLRSVLPKLDATTAKKFDSSLEKIVSADKDEDVVYFAQEALMRR